MFYSNLIFCLVRLTFILVQLKNFNLHAVTFTKLYQLYLLNFLSYSTVHVFFLILHRSTSGSFSIMLTSKDRDVNVKDPDPTPNPPTPGVKIQNFVTETSVNQVPTRTTTKDQNAERHNELNRFVVEGIDTLTFLLWIQYPIYTFSSISHVRCVIREFLLSTKIKIYWFM